MSYFAFKRDDEGRIIITDQQGLEVIEMIVNQLILLNMRFEEAFETHIELEDIENAN